MNGTQVCSLVSVIVVCNGARAGDLSFTLYDLNDLACDEAGVPLGLNDSGVLVGGMSNTVCYGGTAFSWFNGAVTDLNATSDGDEFITALRVSRDGQIVYGVGESGEYVVYLRDGTVKGIGPPPGCDMNWNPIGMNNNGTMGTGTCRGVGDILGVRPAVYWINDGTSIALDPLPGTPDDNPGWAMDVNDDGIVIGHYQFASPEGFRAFTWMDGVMTELVNTLGGEDIGVYAISDSGFIVGAAEDADGNSATMRYDMCTGEMIELGGEGAALDVNDSGDAIGHAYTDAGGLAATLYKDGQIIDLAEFLPSDYWISTPWGINNYGWIVGDAYDVDFNYVWGWLLVPIYAKGDFDGDEDIDLQDFGHFQRCFAAEPYIDGTLHVGCSVFDFDDDVDLDLADYEAFQAAFTGPLTTG